MELVSRFRRQEGAAEEVGPDLRAEVDFTVAARHQPQQLVYVRLALQAFAGYSELSRSLDDELSLLGAVPFGRYPVPIRDVALILNPTDDRQNTRRDAPQVLADALVGLFQSIDLARSNSYLWDRMLGAPPLFDVDIGLLVAALVSSEGAEHTALIERLASRMDAKERRFAEEFIKSVVMIRGSGQGHGMEVR